MAKLSAHGWEIGRIQYTTQMRAYMSDSAVLVNSGSGWKLKGKLKAGLTPESAFKAAQEKQAAIMLNNPAWRDYTKELYSLGGIALTPRLHMTIELMPDDCDGVWSECCDGYGDNVHADIDEISNLCRLYRCAKAFSVGVAL